LSTSLAEVDQGRVLISAFILFTVVDVVGDQWFMPKILATQEAQIRISRPAQTANSDNPISKITRVKWTASIT
jgi:hypothetical protein